MGLLNIRVTTQRNKLICAVLADRAWRTVDIKEGVESQTGITVVEQRLYAGAEDCELPNRERLCNLFPETQDEVTLRLVRRPAEQAQWLARVTEFGLALREAPPQLRDDREVVLAAVRRNWKALEFASERLRADREIALAALAQQQIALAALVQQQDGKVLGFVADAMWADKLFAMNVVQLDGKLLKRAAPALQSDREVVLAAVQQDWHGLEFASTELKADREVLLEAVRRGGWDAMRYAHADARDPARADVELMRLAVQHDWRAVLQADPEVRDDREIAIAAARQDWRALEHLGPWARTDHEVLLACAAQDVCALTLALQEFPVERDVVLALVKRSPHVLAYLPPNMMADEEILAVAVEQEWAASEAAGRAQDAEAEASDNEDIVLRATQLLRRREALEDEETEDEDEEGEEAESEAGEGDAALELASGGLEALSDAGASDAGSGAGRLQRTEEGPLAAAAVA